jgi:hypothetical protein
VQVNGPILDALALDALAPASQHHVQSPSSA